MFTHATVFDTETTGLVDPFIIQCCGKRFELDTFNEVSKFALTRNPGIEIDPGASKINHYINESVSVFKEKYPELAGETFTEVCGYPKMSESDLDYIIDNFGDPATTILIGHNFRFDTNTLNNEYRRLGKENPMMKYRRACTYEMVQLLHPKKTGVLQNHKLGTVAGHYGFDASKLEGLHDAIIDVDATFFIFTKMLEEAGVKTVSDFYAKYATDKILRFKDKMEGLFGNDYSFNYMKEGETAPENRRIIVNSVMISSQNDGYLYGLDYSRDMEMRQFKLSRIIGEVI